MIVLDASVLIAHFGVGDPHAEAALAILDTEEELALHPLTLAEVLVHPARTGRLDQVLDALARLGVEVLAMGRSDAVELARLRASTGLRLPDCCVLLGALGQGAGVATFDDRLRRVADALGLNPQSEAESEPEGD